MIGLIIAVSLMAMDTEYPLYELEGIVVTATRIYQSLKDVPVTTTVVTREEIEALGARDVGEVLRGVAGIEIKSYGPLGSNASVSLRGSASQQVLVLIDGCPVNSIANGCANLGTISLGDIKQIEIVKGAISHLYGANALGGVVNIITRQATGLIIEGNSKYGSFDTWGLKLNQGGKLGQVAYFLTEEHKESDGYRPNSRYEANSLSARFSIHAMERLKVNGCCRYNDALCGIPGPQPAKGVVPKYGNEEVTSLFDHQKDKNFFGSISLEWEPINLSVRTLFDHRELDYYWCHDAYDELWTPYTVDEHDRYLTDILGGSIQSQFRPNKSNIIVSGIDCRQVSFSARQIQTDISAGTDTVVAEWSPSIEEYGVWIEDAWRVIKPINIISGARYDYHSEYGSWISPNLGIACHIGRNTAFRSSLGKAYRSPTFNDLYWPTGGNPELKPEWGVNYELGARHSISGLVTMDVSLFKRDTEDKIAWAPDTGGVWKPTNINQHHLLGGELTLKSPMDRFFSLQISYTYLDAEETVREVVYSEWGGETKTEDRKRKAAFIPRNTLTAGITIKSPWNTDFHLYGKWVDERVNYYSNYSNAPVVTTDTRHLDSYTVIDIRLVQRIGSGNISVGVSNIFNEDYMEQFGDTFEDRGYPMPPRNYRIGINYSL